MGPQSEGTFFFYLFFFFEKRMVRFVMITKRWKDLTKKPNKHGLLDTTLP